MKTRASRPRPSTVLLLLGLMLAPGAVRGSSSSTGEEFLSVSESVEPNVLFLVDLSSVMSSPCPSVSGSTSTTPCIGVVTDAIDRITQHFDWARYGVVGTASNPSSTTFREVVPLGATHAEVSAALATLTPHTTTTRNLGEALANVAEDYFRNTVEDDLDLDEDGDGYLADFNRAPIQYYCQANHIVVITVNRPDDDEDVPTTYRPSVTGDIICDDEEIVLSPDLQCLYDNVANALYNGDFRADLSGSQNLVVHSVLIGHDNDSDDDGIPDTVAESLFGNAADQTDGEGLYLLPEDGDGLLGSLITVMSDVRSGYHSRSAPVLSAGGEYLIYSFYEIDGSNPLAEGHVRAYSVNDDPTSLDYGQIEYLSGTPYDDYGGAYWDAGDLLVSRPVISGETNPNLMQGWGTRDIFTFVDEMMGTALASDALTYRRMGFDQSFAAAIAGDTSLINLFLKNASTISPPYADDDTHDLNDDGLVDDDDMQALIDFTRGLPTATYRYLLGQERGYWKLGDSPHSIPAVISPRNDSFSVDPSYRNYLQTLTNDTTVPSMVYVAANDGMLHAFYLEDDEGTTAEEQGAEAWAWIPGQLVYREQHVAWAGNLLDQVLYGRTFLLDGSPVVDDVWIDENGDGARDCPDVLESVADLEGNCEWHRVLVVQQGKGGPVTLALDVTNPLDPKFLWEQVDTRDETAMGYLVGRPSIAKVYDYRDTSDPVHRWVAIWGSGRAVPYSASTSYYNATEPNLYMWALGDDYFYGTSAQWNDDQALFNATGSTQWDHSSGYRMDEDGSSGHPEWDKIPGRWGLDPDRDGNYEYGYIAASLAVVDADADGDADTIYFPVSTTYGTDDDGDTPGTDIAEPGPAWMWKALIDTTSPADITWCPDPFFDPSTYTLDGSRPPVYYAATTAWMSDGSLGVYWGTGTPYERDSADTGYFFAVRDPTPKTCSTAIAIDCNGLSGIYPLDSGEGLSGDPIVHAGVVYFSTYVPNTDRCEVGTGRLYGIRFDDCSPGMDTNGDGTADSLDDAYESLGSGYASAPTIMNDKVYVATSDASGAGAGLQVYDVATDPFMGTQAISWMEIF